MYVALLCLMSAVAGYVIHVMICQSKKSFKDYEYKFTAKNGMKFTLKFDCIKTERSDFSDGSVDTEYSYVRLKEK